MIQTLPSKVQAKLFEETSSTPNNVNVELAIKLLKRFNLYGKQQAPIPLEDVPLPDLAGANLAEHFKLLGLEQAEPYLSICKTMTQWSRNPGWTMYTADGLSKAVAYPYGECLVFDVEVLVKNGPYPVIATAVSSSAWFSWISPDLFSAMPKMKTLIPFGSVSNERVIIGHNVGYDRSKILEEYTLSPSRLAFVDTMSLHCAVSGLSSQQRSLWNMYQKQLKTDDLDKEDEEDLSKGNPWLKCTSANSLKFVAALHLNKIVAKEKRNIFITGTKEDVRSQFEELMDYCSNDVMTTFEVYKAIFPKYLEKCPHPVSFAAILKMGKTFLTVNQKWDEFIDSAESCYQSKRNEIENHLSELAHEALKYQKDDRWKDDPWLKNLDWTVKPPKSESVKKKSILNSKVELSTQQIERRRKMARKREILEGKPEWYRALWDPSLERILVRLGMRISPFLLRIAYNDHPLLHHPKHGWMYSVPITEHSGQQDFNLKVHFETDPDSKLYHPIASHESSQNNYFQIPTLAGTSKNCGNPLGKTYLKAFETGILKSDNPRALEILKNNRVCGFWSSARDRIMNQFVVWDDEMKKERTGIILPVMVTMGTVTRRAVEGTWMTLSNPKHDRIGSEVKSLVQAPTGYKFIGADVDSEELWIASLLGDSQFGMHGATPLGFMTLQGTKSKGTDLHSRTADILGVTRDDAKIFNYARIYGAGVGYAAKVLKQCTIELNDVALMASAKKLYAETKGTSYYYKNKKRWIGGSESYMFNILEAIIDTEVPRTPALGCAIPDGLMKSAVKEDFLTSRINWVVQSSGVDYLHLLLVSMDYLCRRMKIDVQFVLSIHDEVRYLVKDEHQVLATYALQISNLWTRAFFSYQVGITDLPLSVAFFSSVDIDHCFRKEVTIDCQTPSNRTPIAHGRSETINETLKSLPKGTCLFGNELNSIINIKSTLGKRNSEDIKISSSISDDVTFLELQMAESRKEFNQILNFNS